MLAVPILTPYVSSVTIDGIPVLAGQQLELPRSTMLGFSSASGLWTDYHAVSNVALTYRR